MKIINNHTENKNILYNRVNKQQCPVNRKYLACNIVG